MNTISNIFAQGWNAIISHLPSSPFQQFIKGIEIPYLSELNWFIPVGDILKVLTAWLTVVTVFYIYKAIMKRIDLL